MKLRSSILLNVIVISFIIILVAALMLIFTYFTLFTRNTVALKAQLLNNIESGYTLAEHSTLLGEEYEGEIDLYADHQDSVWIQKRTHGILHYVAVKAHKNNLSIFSGALLGGYKSKEDVYTLYYPDKGRFLYTGKQVSIHGIAYLPGGAINYKDGEYNQINNQDLLIKRSGNYLPSIVASKIEAVYKELPVEKYLLLKDSLFMSLDTIKHQFSEKPILYYSKYNILINKSIIGNVIIKSENNIYIESKVKLEDPIIIAKNIFIDSNFVGSGQFFAKDSLMVLSHCTLKYPSVLCTYNNSSSFFFMGTSSYLEGAIISLNSNATSISSVKNATIKGEVYIQGILDITGAVTGSLSVDNLMSSSSSGVFGSYLRDVKINAFPNDFKRHTLIPLSKNQSLKRVKKIIN